MARQKANGTLHNFIALKQTVAAGS